MWDVCYDDKEIEYKITNTHYKNMYIWRERKETDKLFR